MTLGLVLVVNRVVASEGGSVHGVKGCIPVPSNEDGMVKVFCIVDEVVDVGVDFLAGVGTVTGHVDS